jgi:MFS family permease
MALTADQKKYENHLLILLFFSTGLMFLDRLSINFIAPHLTAEFGFSKTQLGALNALLGGAMAVSGYFIGSLADAKKVKRHLLTAAVFLFSTVSFLSGFATGFVAFVVLRILMGISQGPVIPISQSLMLNASSPNRRGFNMGFIQAVSTGVFGSIVGPLLLITVADSWGWRMALFITGVPALILPYLVMRVVKEPVVHSPIVHHEMDMSTSLSIKNRNVLMCIFIAALYMTTFFSIVIFAPLYLVEERGFTNAQMAIFMGALGVSGVVGGAVVTALSDKFGRRLTLIVSILVSAIAPLYLIGGNGTFLEIVAITCTAYLGVGCFPIFLATIPAESVDRRVSNRAISTVVGVGEIFGACASPVILGALSDHWGHEWPFLIGASTAVVATFFAVFVNETAPQKLAAKAA